MIKKNSMIAPTLYLVYLLFILIINANGHAKMPDHFDLEYYDKAEIAIQIIWNGFICFCNIVTVIKNIAIVVWAEIKFEKLNILYKILVAFQILITIMIIAKNVYSILNFGNDF